MVALLRGLIFASTSITRISKPAVGSRSVLAGRSTCRDSSTEITSSPERLRAIGTTDGTGSPLAVRDEKSIAPPFGNEIGILTGAKNAGQPSLWNVQGRSDLR